MAIGETLVNNKVVTTYVVETNAAIAETQRLAATQQDHARKTAKAMDDFQRDAVSALNKVEKSFQAEAKAAKDAAKAIADTPSLFSRAEGALSRFNSVVGLAHRTLGSWAIAVDVGTTAVGLLSDGVSKLGDAFGSKPGLRMMWEPDPMRGWINGMKEAQAETDKWFAKMQHEFFGNYFDVDSARNLERRFWARQHAKEKRAFDNLNLGYAPDKLDETDKANMAAAGKKPKRSGGGGYELDAAVLSGSGWTVMSAGGLMGQMRTLLDMGDQLSRTLSDVSTDIVGDITAPGGGPRLGKGGQTAAEKQHADWMALLNKEKQPTILERMFGTPEELNFYGDAWGTLTSAITGGYEALVTGSESAGKAMKRIVAGSIMAEGSKMLIHSLEEAAFAVAALATGNFASAATHGKAALMFGAGAAAAGVAAHALGAGGGGGGGASSGVGASAAGVGLGAGGGNDRPINTTIVLGHGWDDESPRQRAERFSREQRRANGVSPPPRGVEYS